MLNRVSKVCQEGFKEAHRRTIADPALVIPSHWRLLTVIHTMNKMIDKLLAKSAVVLALTKRALREGAGHHFEKALDRSQELYLRDLARTEDMVEGMSAFLEKRPPAWRNR